MDYGKNDGKGEDGQIKTASQITVSWTSTHSFIQQILNVYYVPDMSSKQGSHETFNLKVRYLQFQ